MYLIGIVFTVTSVMIAIFKTEIDSFKDTEHNLSLVSSYKMVFRLLRLRPIRFLSFIYLTVNVICLLLGAEQRSIEIVHSRNLGDFPRISVNMHRNLPFSKLFSSFLK
jgi:hypothetical protein